MLRSVGAWPAPPSSASGPTLLLRGSTSRLTSSGGALRASLAANQRSISVN